MAPSQNQHEILLGDPIELVARFVTNQDWLLQRRAENAVLVEVPGKWCDYQLAVTWQHNEEAMQVTCRIDVQCETDRLGEIALLAALLNQQIFMGHLALDIGTGELELRHTLPLRGAGGATPEQIEDVVDIMLGECEHCFPAIYQVARNQLSASDAASASAARFSSFECGEAESCNIRHPFHKFLKQSEQMMAPFSSCNDYSTDSA
jgi:hypothetical protein